MTRRAKKFGAGPAAVVTSAFGKRSRGKRRSIIPRRRKRNPVTQMVSRVSSLGGRKKRRRPEITTVLENVGTVVGAAVAGAQVVSELRRTGQHEEAEPVEEEPTNQRKRRSSSNGRAAERPEAAERQGS
jgi:hypothetical protein